VITSRFEIVCEVAPSRRADLRALHDQLSALAPVATGFLVPDCHLGQATVSSMAVAHEVVRRGGRAIACLNARDRNRLGLQRDLLTAALYGVDEFLFVYGDRGTEPVPGGLTVRTMLAEAREFADSLGRAPACLGVTSRLQPLPAWKREADLLFAQLAFDRDDLLRWRDAVRFEGRVYAGVIVLASAAMARRLSAQTAEITVPASWVEAVERDPRAGLDLSCRLVGEIAASGAFDGVHLVPVGRHRELATALTRESLDIAQRPLPPRARSLQSQTSVAA
jgi:methylenetetrahydrofolate reductase (NADPH)